MSLAEVAHGSCTAPLANAGAGRTALDAGTAAPPRWLLILLTAIGPASFQIFLPSLPAIRDGFGTSTATAQLTLSLSMLGIAVATLGYGWLADRLGRRPTLIGGMALLLAGSLACAAAPSVELLIAGRVLQAAGAASGMVVTRAIVLDVYGRERAGRVMAGLLAAMMIAPMLATPLGGLLNDQVGWRANFLVIAAAAAAALLLVVRRLPETEKIEPGAHKVGLIDGYRRLLGSRNFDAFALQGAFAMAAFVVFTTAAPYALGGVLGLSATQIGIVFVAVSGGFAAGSLLAARLPDSLDDARRLRLGSVVGLAAAGIGAALAMSGVWTLPALIAPAMLFAASVGVTMPASLAGAIGVEPALAGTASGLAGFLGTGLAAAATQVAGAASDGSPLPVALGMAGLAAASMAAALITHWPAAAKAPQANA